jgi:hypothetical protein
VLAGAIGATVLSVSRTPQTGRNAERATAKHQPGRHPS